jgi:hypothetical protein
LDTFSIAVDQLLDEQAPEPEEQDRPARSFKRHARTGKSVLLYDYGMFLYIAQRLAEHFDDVYYFHPWEGSLPVPVMDHLGSGVPGVTKVSSFWDTLNQYKPDLVVFPDVGHSDLQEDLRSRGFNVFGTSKGEVLEFDRSMLRRVLKQVGLPVPPYKVVVGIDALRKELERSTDKYIKISKYRGVCETFYHKNYKHSKAQLNKMAHTLGVLDKSVEFIVEDPLESSVEIGCEWFFTKTGYLPRGMYGYEIKNSAYCGLVCDLDEVPKALKVVMDKFLPVYHHYLVRGALSIELRVSKDGSKRYFIDPCMRFGSPPGEVLSEAYLNMGPLMMAVAEGEELEPRPRATYWAQLVLKARETVTDPLPLDFPPDLTRNLKFRNLACLDHQYYYLPLPGEQETIVGGAVGWGPLIKSAQAMALNAAEKLDSGDEVYWDLDAFEKADEQIKQGEKVGIPF